MKCSYKIRFATKKDIPFIVKGIQEICRIEKENPDKKENIIKITKKALRKKEIKVAVDKNNKPIGFIQFKFTNKTPYGIEYGNYERKYCWIDWMYTSEKYRGKGIGSILHKDILPICKKAKIKEIILDVFQVNPKAKKFYEKEGFREYIYLLKEKI